MHIYENFCTTVLCRRLETRQAYHHIILPADTRNLSERANTSRGKQYDLARRLNKPDHDALWLREPLVLMQLARLWLSKDDKTLPEARTQIQAHKPALRTWGST